MSNHALDFNNDETKYFTRSHTAGNKKKFTIALWVKMNEIGNDGTYVVFGDEATNIAWTLVKFDGNKAIRVTHRYSGSSHDVSSNEKITDTVYWHHVCVNVDTSLPVAADRLKIYLDGTEVTYNNTQYPNQNDEPLASGLWYIGRRRSGNRCRAILDQIYFIDGHTYGPSSFVNADATQGHTFVESYGSASFLIDFENGTSATTLGYDPLNSKHFTPSAAIATTDQTIDAPEIADSLTGNDLTDSSPVLGSPSYFYPGPAPALDLTVPSPQIGTGAFLVKDALTAKDLTVWQPYLDSPAAVAFDDAALGGNWVKSDDARLGGPFINSTGIYQALGLFDTAAYGPFEVSQTISKSTDQELWSFSIEVAPLSDRHVEIGIDDGAGGVAGVVFDPKIGAAVDWINTGDCRLLDSEADPMRFGFYRLTIIMVTSTETTIRPYVRLIDETYNEGYYVGNGQGVIALYNPLLITNVDRRRFRWEIGGPEMRFYWTMHIGNRGLQWFRCGAAEIGVDHHLEIKLAEDLECVVERWKPAHTEVVFDYSTLTAIGGGDPLEGTP